MGGGWERELLFSLEDKRGAVEVGGVFAQWEGGGCFEGGVEVGGRMWFGRLREVVDKHRLFLYFFLYTDA